jgi:hypothetical protein
MKKPAICGAFYFAGFQSGILNFSAFFTRSISMAAIGTIEGRPGFA